MESNAYVSYRTRFICDVLKAEVGTHSDSLVDFGCGDGRIFETIAGLVGARRALGVDYRAPLERSTPIIEYRQANFFELAPDEPFQLVTSIQVFEHIYEPWLERYFAALQRCCAPGGTILISTPNRWRPSNIVRAITLRKPLMMNANPGVPPEQHLGHHRESSYRELAGILDRFFPCSQWRVRIARPRPRRIGSRSRWIANLAVHDLLCWAWIPLCVSASHDHYAVIRRL